MGQLFSALITVIIGVGCGRRLLLRRQQDPRHHLAAARAGALQAARNQKISATIRPWLFLGPALLFLGLYLVYPVINSIRLSFFGRNGVDFVGLSNYIWAANDTQFREVDLQQHPVADRRAGVQHLLRPGHRLPHRPHLVGQHRQEHGLHADGDLVHRRQRHLEIHLRLSRRRLDADRPAQRHRPVFRRRRRRRGSPFRSGTTSS